MAAKAGVDPAKVRQVLLGVLTTLTLFFGLYWGPLIQYANESLRFFIK